jgi:hypothetical protein
MYVENTQFPGEYSILWRILNYLENTQLSGEYSLILFFRKELDQPDGSPAERVPARVQTYSGPPHSPTFSCKVKPMMANVKLAQTMATITKTMT